MKFEAYVFNIGDYFLPAIINVDYSGLEEDEADRLDDFLSYVKETHGPGHWSCNDEERDFARCDVVGLYSDCYRMIYNANNGG